VGEGLCGAPNIPAAVFNSIRDIPVMVISQGSSSSNLTFIVDEDCVRSVVRRLHKTFFENWIEPLPEIASLELEAVAE
jgi:aspartate kinase